MSKSKRKAAFKLLRRGKQYPGLHGKVVDFVDHGWGDPRGRPCRSTTQISVLYQRLSNILDLRG